MAEHTLIIGNKNYSSWSLRGWLPLRQTGVAFDEILIQLRGPDTRRQILQHAPSGRLPILKTPDLIVWDSLAIAEYLAERVPEAGLWPRDPVARARARSICCEMHSGFPDLRAEMPMDMRARRPDQGRTPGVLANIERVTGLWRACRERANGGAFLFGSFGIADAFYAPVVSRFVTYAVPLDPVCAAYRDAVMTWPAMREWMAAAKNEPWEI